MMFSGTAVLDREGPAGSEQPKARKPLQAPVERYSLGGAGGVVPAADQAVREVCRRSSEVPEGCQRQILALDLELRGGEDPLEGAGDVRSGESVAGVENPDEFAQDDPIDQEAIAALDLAVGSRRLDGFVAEHVAQQDVRIEANHRRPAARPRMVAFMSSTDSGLSPFR